MIDAVFPSYYLCLCKRFSHLQRALVSSASKFGL